MAKHTKGKFALGTLIAAGVGYAAGVLTAPKSGKETRKDIKDTASKALAESEKRLKALHSELSKLITTARAKAHTAGSAAKAELDKAIKAAENAKAKASALLSAVHEGEAADKDLDKAIKEAKQAIDHLKQYMASNDKKSKA